MNTRNNFLKVLITLVLIGCGSVLGQSQAKQPIDPAVAKLGKVFF